MPKGKCKNRLLWLDHGKKPTIITNKAIVGEELQQPSALIRNFFHLLPFQKAITGMAIRQLISHHHCRWYTRSVSFSGGTTIVQQITITQFINPYKRALADHLTN